MVWADATEWMRSVLGTGVTVHAWAGQQHDRLDFSGRGLVHAVLAPVSGPDGRSRWAVRHYRRGGAMEGALDDRYLRGGRPRPFRELAASVTARARGVRSPAVIAGVTYAHGIHYRCDLITELVPEATTLAEALHEYDGTSAWREALAAAGDLIGRLAAAGILHADLNARNILLTEAGRVAWVIDLDRAQIMSKPSPSAAGRMRARLMRSVLKIGTPTGERLRESDVATALTDGKGGGGG
jgi:3-deoxy-D-manno-octulosonic acid kinase